MQDNHQDNATQTNTDSSRFLEAVRLICISPEDAKQLVANYRVQAKSKHANLTADEIQDLIAEKIISRYIDLSTISGGLSSLTSIIPGIGTVVAMVGGAVADGAVCMKFQVDMCLCMAEAYGYDVSSEDGKHLAFLVASGGALGKFSSEAATNIASKAGVRLIKQYLKGAALQAIKEFFKRLGIIFTRKALEKALPFGIGVVISASANRILTKYVAKKAKGFFVLDRTMKRDGELV